MLSHTVICKYYRPYPTVTRLKESFHNFDMQQIEAMNTFVAKYAPKTNTYNMTISLANKVMTAIEIRNLGSEKF